MLNTNKRKIIYSLRVYVGLKERGFIPIATTENPTKPNFMCWIFERSDEFDDALRELMSECKNYKSGGEKSNG